MLTRSVPLSCLALHRDSGTQLTGSDTFLPHIRRLSRAAGLPRFSWSSAYCLGWGSGNGDKGECSLGLLEGTSNERGPWRGQAGQWSGLLTSTENHTTELWAQRLERPQCWFALQFNHLFLLESNLVSPPGALGWMPPLYCLLGEASLWGVG